MKNENKLVKGENVFLSL